MKIFCGQKVDVKNYFKRKISLSRKAMQMEPWFLPAYAWTKFGSERAPWSIRSWCIPFQYFTAFSTADLYRGTIVDLPFCWKTLSIVVVRKRHADELCSLWETSIRRRKRKESSGFHCPLLLVFFSDYRNNADIQFSFTANEKLFSVQQGWRSCAMWLWAMWLSGWFFR